MASPISWISADETAKEALLGLLNERPLVVLPPPLHRMPFRAGNVVEIVGTSPSAKTLILIQAAINCILPKVWKGVLYGGLEREVMFVDLDCRFSIFSLSQALERRIGLFDGSIRGSNKNNCDRELFSICMRRFLYIRCYSSLEFLATLKTMHHRLQKEKETLSGGVYMLIIDSIGAYYWMDRALPTSSSRNNSSKSLSLQSMAETMVQELRRLLMVHPMFVLASKSASVGVKQSTSEVIRNFGKGHTEHLWRGSHSQSHHEYMPFVWQSFVTHRILLRASDDNREPQNHSTFFTEWLLPAVKLSDHFKIDDNGAIFIL